MEALKDRSKSEGFNFHYHSSTDQSGTPLNRLEAPVKNVEKLFLLQLGAEKDLRIQFLLNPKVPSETHTEGYQIYACR
ncbi:MAG: hypothetical protein canaca05_12070 [Anaerolineaceae bacterium]